MNMNGIDLLRKIREKDAPPPVITMTAYGDKDLVIDAMRNSCDSFIEKPFTLEILMNEIDGVMLRVSAQQSCVKFLSVHGLNMLGCRTT